ncbi:unnamed protein product [Durusdinium trenchii]|uniref:Inositol-pentakisphosphate 2-kinase n=1 Tax=Durusdinium trenchii TaxID=1381693 RepID=A0ABP0PLI1_9DINO
MEGKLSKRARPEKEEEMNVKQRKLDSWCRPRSETPAAVATPSRAGSWMLEELPDAASLRLKGTMRMDVRSKRKEEVVVIPDSDEERETVPKRSTKGILRVSAGRAAAVAGIHCYADVGEVFLELLYQDQPELLLADAQLAGVEVVSPQLERARLVEKSGEATGLEAALKAAQEAQNVEAAEGARSQLRDLVAKAKADGRITAEEAAELQQTLELEVNLDFGARHEDSAIERYEKKVGSKVYGQQQRVFLPMPVDGPQFAVCQAFPPPFISAVRPREEKPKEDQGARPLFFLTGYVDGLVDVQRDSPAPGAAATPLSTSHADETLVVEVKHRMGRIKDPPNIYDVVQLCSYCRALGCLRGDLVQCLRGKRDGEQLHVTRIDFSDAWIGTGRRSQRHGHP